jgi:putative transposase
MFRFHYGLHLAIKGEEHVITELLDDGFCTLRKVLTTTTITYSCSELRVMYVRGDLSALYSGVEQHLLPAALKNKLSRDLVTFPEELIDAAKKMLVYVKAVEARCVSLARAPLTAMIAGVAEETNDPSPPSWSRVYYYHRLWIASRKHFAALIPDYCNRGRRSISSIPLVGTTMMRVIGELYMVRNYSSMSDIHLEIKNQIEVLNKNRGPRSQLPVPSPSTVAREIARIPKNEVAIAQMGERAGRIAFRSTGQGVRTTRPLEITQIDHSPSDLIVIDDETFLPLGRLKLTAIVDNHTQSILDIGDEFADESSSTVARSLRRAILPKDDLLKEFPEVKNKWRCCGTPEILLWDNAMHFHSNHLALAGLKLGCDIKYGPKNMPYYRALVEELLGFLNRSCLQNLPGTTFSNVLRRGDYDPVKNGVIIPICEIACKGVKHE